MTQIRDMLFVNSLERQLNRKLTPDELVGEEFKVKFPDGHVEWIQVPLLEFPFDLLTKPEDIFVSELQGLEDAA